ncbi:MAG: zf-HC2 domain-containing protein [Acidobacteriia bacterium]|nr:zf-HC2 domain-containing protein [Terriglobia bacterium]
MICLSKNEQGAELLANYLAKTLDAPRTAELARHIQECSDCRGLASVWERLDEFAVPEVSPGFDARLYARIAREEARLSLRTTWKSWRRWLWPPVAPLAAAAAVAALVLFLQVPGTPDAAKQANPTQSSKAEIEQVAQAVDDLDLLTPIDK